MSWTDLFKSKSGGSSYDPSIRWFGKLPTYSDYYRSPSDEEWAVEFNSWVLKGFERYRGRLTEVGRPYVKLPLAGAVIRLPKSKMTVITAILDYGGDMRGRSFPLFFYVGLPTAQLAGPTSDSIASISHALGQLLGLRREVARFINSPGCLDHVFGDREIDLEDVVEGHKDSNWLQSGKSVAFADWFERAKPGLAAKDHEEWSRMIAVWSSRISEQNGKNFEPTLRFPLAPRLSRDIQIAGWMHWLGERMKLDNRYLTLFVTGDPDVGQGQLTIVARDLMDDDFLLLTVLANELPFVDSLCAKPDDESHVGEGDSPPQEQDNQAAASPGATQASAPGEGDAEAVDSTSAAAADDGRSWIDFVCAPGVST
ncbi:MAG: hypothetical protein ACYTHJ_17565 [Planctomycetota bacterium]|jgi:hypothetical protein